MYAALAIITLAWWMWISPKRPHKRGEDVPAPFEHHWEVDEFGLYEVMGDDERQRIYH